MLIAAITAGGRVPLAFAEAIGTDVKALAPLGSQRLIDRSIDAARAAGAQRIVVIGDARVRAHCGDRIDETIDDAADGRENVRRALHAADGNGLLFLTSDLPFVDGPAVEAFMRRAEGAGVAMPLASQTDYAAAFPGAPNHATAIGGERVVNGSVFYFAPGTAPRIETLAQDFFDARKSLWRMALLTGPALLLKFATGRLRIEDVEARAQAVLGVEARAVRGSSPALCYDVDSLDDYRYALGRLERG